MQCPLCSLCGVSYDELCFHISSAHPEKQHGPRTHSPPSCSAQTSMQAAPMTSPHRWASACEATHTAATYLAQSEQSGSNGLSAEETAPITPPLKTKAQKCKSSGHCNVNNNGIKSDHKKVKLKQMSPREGNQTFSDVVSNFKVTIEWNYHVCWCFIILRGAFLLPHVCAGLQQRSHPTGTC